MAAGSNDMSNNGFDPMAQYARLSERVENQGKDIVDLRSNMNTGFQSVNASLSTLSHELRSNSKTQWPVIWAAIGVSFSVLGVVGAMAYFPIREGQVEVKTDIRAVSTETKGAIATLADRIVTQKEMEWRTARGTEDRARMEAGIKEVREAQVPRAELDRVFASFVQQFADHQRQIDEVKTAQGSVYGTRDVVFDLKKEIERLRDRDRQRGTSGAGG
jgi:hypothetical protein